MAYIDDKLGRGEKIVYTAHQHWIVLARSAIKWVGLFILAMVVVILLNPTTTPADEPLRTIKSIAFIACALVAVIALVAFFWSYIVWQSEEYILTNERVVQVTGIINKNMYDSSLDKINDIQTLQTILGRMLGYATIELQTASETGVNDLRDVGDPFEFKRRMLDAKNGFYGDASDAARGHIPAQPMPQARAAQPIPRPDMPQYAQRPDSGFYNPRPEGQYNQPQQPRYDAYQAAPQQQDIPAMIAQLAKLRDAGAITEAEFQEKKNDLLRRM